MKATTNRFWNDQQGLETIEYAIVAGLIVTGVILAVAAIATWLSTRWTNVQTTLGTP